MMVYKGILRYMDCRKIGLNMLRKGWPFIAQVDPHPSYHYPRNVVPVRYPEKSCAKVAITECVRLGGQQCAVASA